MLKLLCRIALVIGIGMSDALAVPIYVSEVPTLWRLQHFVGGVWGGYYIFVYYPPTYGVSLWPGTSICHNIVIDIGVQPYEQTRFFNMVTAARLAGQKVFVYYDTATCVISSFGMDGL